MKTCTKESAQRLVELGVTVKSEFMFDITSGRLRHTNKAVVIPKEHWTPAWTACELGEMFRYMGPSWSTITQSKGWMCITDIDGQSREHWEFADTEAEARALMLIWLLEQDHITAEEINEEATE